jgi:hypothetical protein
MISKKNIPKVKRFLIPKDFLLYRTSFNKGILQPTRCEDTGKFGTYFATMPCIALGMALEYESDMTFSIYKLKKDLKAIEGKYGYRYLFPERHFDSEGEIRIDVDALSDENVNHFETGIYPIADFETYFPDKFVFDEKWYDGEFFINDKDLKYVQIVENYDLSYKKLKKEWVKKLPFSRCEMFEKSLEYSK